jgi:hypothetical protein
MAQNAIKFKIWLKTFDIGKKYFLGKLIFAIGSKNEVEVPSFGAMKI